MLKDKWAIITGCNRGIGKSILKIFAKNKANIFACSRENNKNFIDFLDDLKKKNDVEIYPIFFDLNNKEEMSLGFKEIRKHNKQIDILVNNAGAIHSSLFEMSNAKKFKDLFETNFFSQIEIIQNSLKMMKKKQNGTIVNISSTSGDDNNFGRSIYSATKASFNSLTKSLSNELSVYKIRVNAISPGLTETDMMKENTSKEVIEKIISRNPLKRLASPDEIANVALFLASNLSSYVNGQVIRVDGGIQYYDQF